MGTLIAALLSNWDHSAMRKWTLDGGRFVSESRLTTIWMKEDNNNSGKFWSGTKTFLLGTRVN
jgi:hypothetical protein